MKASQLVGLPDPLFIRANITTKKVGCVLMQAAGGGTPGVANLFDNEHWETNGLDDLTLYRVTKAQLMAFWKHVHKKRSR